MLHTLNVFFSSSFSVLGFLGVVITEYQPHMLCVLNEY